jgi:hypothetical protein
VAGIPRHRPYCRVVAYRQQHGPTCCPLGNVAGTFCRPGQVTEASRSHLLRGQSFFGHRSGSRIHARGAVRFAACFVRTREAVGLGRATASRIPVSSVNRRAKMTPNWSAPPSVDRIRPRI